LSTLAGVVLSEETLDAVLEMIVSLAVSAIPDVYGASVSLARPGKLVTANATSETVRELDAIQYQAGRGPCVDATRTGERQHAIGETLPARWPAFGSAAAEAGIEAMLSTPVEARGRAVGALNLYAQTQDAFDDAPANLAAVFAHRCGSDEAFDVLRRASQHANVKLHDIAAELVRSSESDASQ
jgi:GAF domain-containing protein